MPLGSTLDRNRRTRWVAGGFTVILGAMLMCAPAATAARLAKPREARALRAAFFREKGHKGALITAITVSTRARGWAAVAYLPASATHARAATPKIIVIRREYYDDRSVSHPKRAKPPKKAKDDLAKDFWVKLAYIGSGSENLDAKYTESQVCNDGSDASNHVTMSVTPARWKVEYLADLDRMTAGIGVTGDQWAFDPLLRLVSAPTDLSMVTNIKHDRMCAGDSSGYSCIETFAAPRTLLPTGFVELTDRGTEITVPATLSTKQGTPLPGRAGLTACDDPGTILGVSRERFDPGVGVGLHLMGGGGLPANPYAPVPVSQRNALARQNECQTSFQNNDSCSDTITWSGTVELSVPR